jgi:hypothetical protein
LGLIGDVHQCCRLANSYNAVYLSHARNRCKQIIVTKSWQISERLHAADKIVPPAEIKPLRAGHFRRDTNVARR